MNEDKNINIADQYNWGHIQQILASVEEVILGVF